MRIREIKAKSIFSKSGLSSDIVINPYVGCIHGCIYCFARFMKKFTDHHEPWGEFVDVKINAPDLIPEKTDKYRNKSILISSVTDAYQPIEKRYQLTRKILIKLIPLEPRLTILTKSDLVLRDVDLFKQFKNCKVGFSLSLLDDKTRKEVEPIASSVERRINAVRELRKQGIHNFIFLSPLLPELNDWRGVVETTKDFVDEFWFENLNMKPTIWPNVKGWLKSKHPELLRKYEEIYFGKSDYWDSIEEQISSFGKQNKLNFSIYFHH